MIQILSTSSQKRCVFYRLSFSLYFYLNRANKELICVFFFCIFVPIFFYAALTWNGFEFFFLYNCHYIFYLSALTWNWFVFYCLVLCLKPRWYDSEFLRLFLGLVVERLNRMAWLIFTSLLLVKHWVKKFMIILKTVQIWLYFCSFSAVTASEIFVWQSL